MQKQLISNVTLFRALYTLITGKNRELALLSKLFEGFLDDGPQFVLRVVVVVLFGIGIGQEKRKLLKMFHRNL